MAIQMRYSDARQWWSDGDATAAEPSRNVRRKAKGGMAVGEAMWPEINAMRVTIASFLADTALVSHSGASAAADGQPAITPAGKCEALEHLGFSGSRIVIEKAEAVP